MAENSAVLRVLIVDDEPLIRWSLAETLAHAGHTVVEAGDAKQTVQILTAGPAPDIIVLDYRLPDSNDLKLLATIRQTAPRSPVILMTAYGTADVVIGAVKLGAYRVVGKSFEVRDVGATDPAGIRVASGVTLDGCWRSDSLNDAAAIPRPPPGEHEGLMSLSDNFCAPRECPSILAAILEKSEDAVIRADLDGVIIGWSPGASRLYGYTAEETIGSSVGMLIPDEKWDEFLGMLEQIRTGAAVNHRETVRRAKDGRLVNVALSILPVADEASRTVSALSIARDLTVVKYAESAYRASEARWRAIIDSAVDAIT